MIIPSRWFAGGKGLDLFRERNLKDKHYRMFFDYPNLKDCFPTANICGGVCYFLYDKNYNGDCVYTNVIAGKRDTALRKLDEFDVFIWYNNAISIIHKITSTSSLFLMNIVSVRNPFGIDSSIRGKSQKSQDSPLTLYSSKGIGSVSEDRIKDTFKLVNSYKIFMGKVLSGHLGETDENGQVKVISTIIEAKPKQVSTDSYLAFGPFMNECNVANLHKYLRAKFLRFLLLQAFTSMNISRGNFRFVPL